MQIKITEVKPGGLVISDPAFNLIAKHCLVYNKACPGDWTLNLSTKESPSDNKVLSSLVLTSDSVSEGTWEEDRRPLKIKGKDLVICKRADYQGLQGVTNSLPPVWQPRDYRIEVRKTALGYISGIRVDLQVPDPKPEPKPVPKPEPAKVPPPAPVRKPVAPPVAEPKPRAATPPKSRPKGVVDGTKGKAKPTASVKKSKYKKKK